MKIKTIDVTAKEWFDRINGNSYFSMNITVNFGMKNEDSFFVPMQIGYERQFEFETFQELKDRNLIKVPKSNFSIWKFYQDNEIIVRYNKIENCKKSELKY